MGSDDGCHHSRAHYSIDMLLLQVSSPEPSAVADLLDSPPLVLISLTAHRKKIANTCCRITALLFPFIPSALLDL